MHIPPEERQRPDSPRRPLGGSAARPGLPGAASPDALPAGDTRLPPPLRSAPRPAAPRRTEGPRAAPAPAAPTAHRQTAARRRGHGIYKNTKEKWLLDCSGGKMLEVCKCNSPFVITVWRGAGLLGWFFIPSSPSPRSSVLFFETVLETVQYLGVKGKVRERSSLPGSVACCLILRGEMSTESNTDLSSGWIKWRRSVVWKPTDWHCSGPGDLSLWFLEELQFSGSQPDTVTTPQSGQQRAGERNKQAQRLN